MSAYKKIRQNQSGMVSIMVTMIMILVITLIVIGFSELVRRNASEALDKQLSTQAYYAAETGINDTVKAVFTNHQAVQAGDGNTCNAFTTRVGLAKNLNTDGTVGYTCVLVNDAAKNVVSTVPVDVSQTANLDMSVAPGTLNFTWQPGKDTTTLHASTCPTYATSNAFTPDGGAATDWQAQCPYAILRIDLFAADGNPGATNPGDPEAMANSTVSLFFVPSNSAAAVPLTFGDASKAVYTVRANCDDTSCVGSVSNISGLHYYARLSSVYKESVGQVTIAATNPNVVFKGYLLIDSTGKAQDVLRRVEVRIPYAQEAGFPVPLNALTSGSSICKRFVIKGAGDTANSGGDGAAIPTELCSP